MQSAPRVALQDIVRYLDAVLRTHEVPDYAGAMNGIQVEHDGPVTRCAVAVDASLHTIDAAIASHANLLVVHHGLFWGGTQPLRGRVFKRVRRLVTHDVAVYASHLPLDLHPTLGNNAILARTLELTPSAGFAHFQSVAIGLMGDTDVSTSSLADRCDTLARQEGGRLVAVGLTPGRRTRRWALCTGAGATSETLAEAAAAGADTLIVGEGAHHTAVEASELGIAVLYVGHYATETFGVRALGEEIERTFGIPWGFVAAPTGL